jgi:two-component system, LytTR family, sensor kinase
MITQATKHWHKLQDHDLFRHIIFWIFVAILVTLLGAKQGNFLFVLSNELINVFFYGILVYFNLNYLVKHYLYKNKFFIYATLMILAAVIITPIKAVVFYMKFTHYPLTRNELIQNLNWYFLLHVFVAGVSTVIKIIADWARQMRERQELENQTMQSELRFLKSQINPHFLFNTLNNLYALTLKKSDDAPEIVIKLSEMMRYMLYDCNEKQVLLSKEIEYLQNYLDLERLRQHKTTDIQFDVIGDIGQQTIAPLLFIPFLENSFKHGITNALEASFIHIRLTARGNQVEFDIENSRPAQLPSTGMKRSGGIGLVNVKRRLQLLYPEAYQLDIQENPDTYHVTLKINI